MVVVEIRDYKYLPAQLRIQAGTTVRWVNAEKRTTHTVRFAGADGMESERLFPGESFERRFDKPGAYDYICRGRTRRPGPSAPGRPRGPGSSSVCVPGAQHLWPAPPGGRTA